MYRFEEPVDFEKDNTLDLLMPFKNDLFDSDIKEEYEIKIEEPNDEKDFEEFILYQENTDTPISPIPRAYLNRTKDNSSSMKDNIFESNSNCKSDTHSTVQSHIQVSFEGTDPDMDDFIQKVREEICFRGVNEIICEALEIKDDTDLELDSKQFIRIKKRKTKEQLKALEAEFAVTNDWTKESMNDLAKKLDLDPSQVYKWHWDQISKKLGKTPKRKAKQQKTNNKRKRTTKKQSSQNKKRKSS